MQLLYKAISYELFKSRVSDLPDLILYEPLDPIDVFTKLLNAYGKNYIKIRTTKNS